MSTTIWWLRRDLRLADNQALRAAVQGGESVIPLFILDPALLNSPNAGEKRTAFLLGGLRALDEDLRRRGSYLVVRRGEPGRQLAALINETGAAGIYAEADVTPYARRRDAALAAALTLHLQPGVSVLPPDAVLRSDGSPYTVFTPFSKRWDELTRRDNTAPLPVPERIATPPSIHTLPIPDTPRLPPTVPFSPGEAEAHRRLAAFAAGEEGPDGAPIYRYTTGRDRLDLAGTSALSPYLRLGMLSARQAAWAARQAWRDSQEDESRLGALKWLSELVWREFYLSILYHFPHVALGSFRPQYDRVRWRNDPEQFAAWRAGRTGYPVVDAAMRQLQESGWMHNRARMITASFLVKDLLIDWRWGERWFMQQLVDGDPASNNGGWQWSAGVGTDAAPYFRIFNPVLQGRKFDPRGDYVRRWLPELANVPDYLLHDPWRMSPAEQRAAGCVIGIDYPAAIVDHARAREAVLAAFAAAREEPW